MCFFLRTNETYAKTDKRNCHDAFLTNQNTAYVSNKIYSKVRAREQTQAQSRAQLRTYSESFITSKLFSKLS